MRGLQIELVVFITALAVAAPVNAQWTWHEGTPQRTDPPPRDYRNPYSDSSQSPEVWRGWRQQPSTWDQPQQRQLRGDTADQLRDGGARPVIAPLAPPIVPFPLPYPPNTIVIDSSGKQLYFVLANNRAYAYQIAVGREGFDWFGTETISRKQEWPDWHPPAEMRARDPKLPVKMTGGVNNPLGAMALYLGTTLYRIHGTNDERSLGRAGSSGCFRMMNANVLHLASLADVGTTVHVVRTLGLPRIGVAQAPSRSELSGRSPPIDGDAPPYANPRPYGNADARPAPRDYREPWWDDRDMRRERPYYGWRR